MDGLAEMIARVAQPGRIVWIGLRPARRAPLVVTESARLGLEGLEGDHGRAGARAVTLMQDEHRAAVGAFLGQGPVAPEVLRRNLVVAGINLAALKGRDLAVGSAVVRIAVVCAPCSRMEVALGPGGYAALRGHGGWCAEVVQPGAIALGDRVYPL